MDLEVVNERHDKSSEVHANAYKIENLLRQTCEVDRAAQKKRSAK